MLFDQSVPVLIKGLRNLSSILEKANSFADSKKVQFEVLLNSRLAVDQFTLTRQIQIACDTAKLGVSRLTTVAAPSHDDSEKTYSEIQTRIQQTVDYLGTIKQEHFNGAADRHITQPRWEGKYLTGEEYLRHHVLPNFYFHITTAYAILRHLGVDIGKKDYLGEMPFKK